MISNFDEPAARDSCFLIIIIISLQPQWNRAMEIPFDSTDSEPKDILYFTSALWKKQKTYPSLSFVKQQHEGCRNDQNLLSTSHFLPSHMKFPMLTSHRAVAIVYQQWKAIKNLPIRCF
jgi:hypothetical protein